MAESIQVMARDAIFLDVDYRYSYPQRDIEERRITEGYYKSSGTSNDRFDGIYANTYIPFHGIQDGGLIIKSSTLKNDNKTIIKVITTYNSEFDGDYNISNIEELSEVLTKINI